MSKLLNQVRDAIRLKHYSLRTEEAYIFIPDVIDKFIFIYSTWNAEFNNFILIARQLNDVRKGNQKELNLGPLWMPVFPTITKDNKLKVEPDTAIFEALNGIDYDRLRICTICNKIFWAKNKNSETCSKTCLNALRQRRHREKNKEAINVKRRESYQSKKEQKLGKKRAKKKGTL